MFDSIISSILIPVLLFSIFPTDGASVEAAVSGRDMEVTAYGDNGGLSHTWLPGTIRRDLAPIKSDANTFGVSISAPSAIVIDDRSGAMLYGKRPYDLRSIGSVTKLMAVMVFLDQNPDLNQVVALNRSTDLVFGGRDHIGFNEPIRLRHILAATLIASDNSSARSLMRFSGLTSEEFIQAMNDKALELGLGNANFTEPTGIDPANRATAQQLIRLLQEANKYEEIARYSRMAELNISYESGRSARLVNTNRLLSTDMNSGNTSIIGGKTGYLPEAGYVLTSSITRGGNTIHIAVMGADSIESRAEEVRALAEWTFNTFYWPN